jgi:hypothetical protein
VCKRKCIQAKGTLTAKESVRLTTLKEFAVRSNCSNRKKAKKKVRIKAGKPS